MPLVRFFLPSVGGRVGDLASLAERAHFAIAFRRGTKRKAKRKAAMRAPIERLLPEVRHSALCTLCLVSFTPSFDIIRGMLGHVRAVVQQGGRGKS